MWIFKGVEKQNLNIEYWKNEVKDVKGMWKRVKQAVVDGARKNVWLCKDVEKESYKRLRFNLQ